jgi:hypothetical protein
MSSKDDVALRDARNFRDGEESVQVPERRPVGLIRRDLQTRGVAGVAAEALSTLIASKVESQDPEAYEAMLDGVALAVASHSEVGDGNTDRAGECREIERLMGSFAEELNKLDEVLQVLAAHLSRMRSTAAPESERVVH